MAEFGIDLAAYCARIGYDGPREPTLDVLRALHLRHALAIPFENLDPFLGRPVRLDPPALYNKLIGGDRGGYCFEQNRLFADALEALGFRVTGLAARVLWNRPEDTVTPRGHMVLAVVLDGETGGETWIADVGFGGMTLTAPLRLLRDGAQETPHEPFRIVQGPDGDYRVQAQLRDTWPTLYRFDLQPQHPVDYEVSNYFLSTHPQSHFITGLVAARPIEGGRLGLMNNQLATHRLGRPSERRTLASAEELRAVLADLFDVRVPDPARFDALVEDRGILDAAAA